MSTRPDHPDSEPPPAHGDEGSVTREVRFYLEHEQLLSRLRPSELANGPEDAIRQLRKWMEEEDVGAQPTPWWSLVVRPGPTMRLRGGRRNKVESKRLGRLATVALYGADIGVWEARLLRRAIAAGKITQWQAYCLLTSGGCRIHASGSIEPIEPSNASIRGGALAISILASLTSLLLFAAVADYMAGCLSGCGLLGTLLVLPYLFGFGYMAHNVTFRRRSAARALGALLRQGNASHWSQASAR